MTIKQTTAEEPFSITLEHWLKDKKPKTIGSMLDVFDEKSFAFMFFILLLVPALPLPTGGLSHVFEVIAILLALQLMIGRQELWLPKSLIKRELPQSAATKIIPYVKSKIQWLEKYTKSRGAVLMTTRPFRMQLGFVVVILSVAAFIAPPFSFLDTLPSLGVVLISLGIILEDIYVLIAGYFIGFLGLLLIFFLGSGILSLIAHFI